jgi:Fur family transcriptional regulator, iron response regulator
MRMRSSVDETRAAYLARLCSNSSNLHTTRDLSKCRSYNHRVKAPASASSATAESARKLASLGIRPTAQRARIASLLMSGPQHLSAEQILARLRAGGARVSKATVYNTLNLFARRGLVRPLSVDHDRSWFDSNVEPHYHFHDTASGRLTDVPVPDVEFRRLPAPPEGMEVAGIDLVIRLRKKL